MFENDGHLYYIALVYFGFSLPFAVFSSIMSVYYFFSWIFSRKTQLLKAAVYCFLDGTFSLAFSCLGLWLVIREIADVWIIFFVGVAISIPHVFIARKFRLEIFQDTES